MEILRIPKKEISVIRRFPFVQGSGVASHRDEETFLRKTRISVRITTDEDSFQKEFSIEWNSAEDLNLEIVSGSVGSFPSFMPDGKIRK